MRLKRIANVRHADLKGGGGMLFDGRWHTRGRPIVYLAENAALALLELVVHMEVPHAALPNYVLLDVDVPDDVEVECADWVEIDEAPCRAFGDAWLASGRTALCRVRSILVPDGFNLLLNPAHPDAGRIEIVSTTPLPIDPRLAPDGR